MVLNAKRGTEAPRQCLSWVNRVILVVARLLPVFPWKRTSSGSVAMSQGANTGSQLCLGSVVQLRVMSGGCKIPCCSIRQPEFSQVFCHTVQDGGGKDHCLFEF